MAVANLAEIVDRIVYLPSSPDIATKISRVAEDARSCADDIAQVVRKDPSTAARILRLVNSSYFGLRSEVKTLSHAVSMLGIKVIRSVALSVSVVGSFKKMKVPVSFNHRRFWEHSALTGCMARLIAKECRSVDPELAFDVGLMHDIGKLILACYASADFEQVIATAQQNELSFVAAERQIMGTTHAEIGGWLADKWKFAPELVHGIRDHHEKLGGGDDPIVAVCQFANALSKAKGSRTVGSHEKVTLPKGVLEKLNIDDAVVTRLFAAADEEIDKSEQLISNMTG